MAARSEERAKAAILRLHEQGLGKGEVEWWPLDLSVPKGVKESAERFLEKEKRLDILGECCFLDGAFKGLSSCCDDGGEIVNNAAM